jgi:hypothetical protein
MQKTQLEIISKMNLKEKVYREIENYFHPLKTIGSTSYFDIPIFVK